MDAELARLVVAAEAIAAPIAAVEAQWEDVGASVSGGWRLDLCVIVERPGRDHARYRSVRLASPPADRAAEMAQALAAALRVPVMVTSVADRCGLDGSRWIEAQPAALADYDVRWEARTWTDDGDQVVESGTTTWTSSSGFEACLAVERAVADNLGAAARPVDVRSRLEDADRWWWSDKAHQLPGFAAVDELRRWHLAGRSIAAIVAELRDRALDVLSVMRLLAEAFAIPLVELGPVADHAAGRIGAGALDEALDPVVGAHRPIWDRARRLLDAHQRGVSLAAVLRAERDAGANIIQLIVSLREAFGLPLGIAKSAADRRDPAYDAALDDELAVAIAERAR